MRLQGCQLPLLLLVLISPWPLTPSLGKFRSGFRSLFASAAFVNFTIDDTSSLIVYSPASNWRPSTTACSTCLGPDPKLAYATTWHDGTHIIPTVDSDDLPPGQSDLDDTNPTTHSTSSTRAPVPTHSGGANKQKGKGKGGGDDDDDEDSDHSGGKGDGDDKKSGNDNDKRDTAAVRSARHLSARDDSDGDDNPFFTEKGDSDDPGFVDQPVSLSFNFTGSAVYVYALVPLFTAASNTTPTFVNLTYTLDSQPSGNYLHTGSPSVQSSPTAYLSSFPVFQRTGLPDTPHTLTVNVGPDSVFLLDYIVYTQDSELGEVPNDPPSSGLTGSTSGSQPTTSVGPASPTAAMSQATNSSTPSSKSHNVATFAGAVGGSVGLLSLLALSLAFSLYRRRLKARRRDREYRERHYGQGGSVSTFHTESSHDGPPMQGPAPFVPRYFPGTIINTAPPPYSPPAPPSNEATSTLLEQPETPVPSMSWSSRRWGNANVESDSASYADRPPPTPPLTATANAADVEDGYFAPPPAFQAAIATPVPAILAGLSGTAVASSSSSPAPRSSTPTPPSPIIPLLAPPPSSRPVTITNISLQPPAMGPSGSHTAIVSGPGSIASPRSLRIHPSVESISLSGIDINPSSSHDSHSPLPSVPVAPSPSASTIARPTGDAEIRRSRSGESVRSGVGR